MPTRLHRIAAVSVLLLAPLAVFSASGSAVAADDPAPRPCASFAPPCLASASMDGAAMPANYDIAMLRPWVVGAPEDNMLVEVVKNKGAGLGYQLDPSDAGHVFTMDIDMGTVFKPRVVTGWALRQDSSRYVDGLGHWHVVLSLSPAHKLNACRYDTCPVTAPRYSTPGDPTSGEQEEWVLSATIDDAGWWSTSDAERGQLDGFEMFTDVNIAWVPPELQVGTDGSTRLVTKLQNARYYWDGRLFRGHLDLRLPNGMLHDIYGIPDPATMVPSSLAADVAGAGADTVTVANETGNGAMIVGVDGITFPDAGTTARGARRAQPHTGPRTARVSEGTIVPTAPRNVAATRPGDHKGKITFGQATPRGARVTGYRARCVNAVNSRDVVTGRAEGSPLVVTGLATGRAYDCKVWATSRAGDGVRAAVRVPRT